MENAIPSSAEVTRAEFDAFKSSVCHRLKALGNTDFIIQISLETQEKARITVYRRSSLLVRNFSVCRSFNP